VGPIDAGPRPDAGPRDGDDAGTRKPCDTLRVTEEVHVVQPDEEAGVAVPIALVRTRSGFAAYTRVGDGRIFHAPLSIEGGRLRTGVRGVITFQPDAVRAREDRRMLCRRDGQLQEVDPGHRPAWESRIEGRSCHVFEGGHDRWLVFTDVSREGDPAASRYPLFDGAGARLTDRAFRSLEGAARSVRAATTTRTGFAWVSTGPYGLGDVEVSALGSTRLDAQSAPLAGVRESEAIEEWPYGAGGAFSVTSGSGPLSVILLDDELAVVGESDPVAPNGCRAAMARGDFGLLLIVEESHEAESPRTTAFRVDAGLGIEALVSFERTRMGCSYLGVETDGRNVVVLAREPDAAVAWLLSCD
jgi:hypothetical protein